MQRLRRPSGAWVIAIALLAVGCAGGPSGDAAGVPETPAAPATTEEESVDDPATGAASDAEDAPQTEADGGPDVGAPDDDGVEVPPDDLLDRISAADPRGFEPAASAEGLPSGVHPERIVIPAIGVDAEVIELGLQDDGEMEVPSDFSQAGWFRHGPRPGRVGPAVIAGHVDDQSGPTVFFHLADLEPGDRIEVHGDDGNEVVFEVREIEQHPKDAFPTERVYAATPGPELRLVTCGGVFDRDERSYRDNIIVWAERVDA